MNSGTALRLLIKGARTRGRKIIPPIQLTAASIWSQTRKTVIATANPLLAFHENLPGNCFATAVASVSAMT